MLGLRDVGLFYVGDKDARLAWFRIVLRDVVGAMASATGVLSDYGVDIKFGYFDTLERGVRGKYVVFVELGDANPGEVATCLKGLEVVLDVDWMEAHEVIFQTADFPLTMLDSRAIITRAATFVEMTRTLEEVSERSGVLLFRSGLKVGEDAAQYFMGETGGGGPEGVCYMAGVLIAQGWAWPDVDVDESGRGRVFLEDSFIAREYGHARESKCAFLAGWMAGYLSVVIGVDVMVREERCEATGADRCEFTVRPASQVPRSRSV